MSSSVPPLSPAQLRAALDVRDLSDPAAGPHAIQILTDRVVAALARTWSCEVRRPSGPVPSHGSASITLLEQMRFALQREMRSERSPENLANVTLLSQLAFASDTPIGGEVRARNALSKDAAWVS